MAQQLMAMTWLSLMETATVVGEYLRGKGRHVPSGIRVTMMRSFELAVTHNARPQPKPTGASPSIPRLTSLPKVLGSGENMMVPSMPQLTTPLGVTARPMILFLCGSP